MSSSNGIKSNLRSGAEYLAALNDGRRLIVNGEPIDNVGTHRLTREYAATVAAWYDVHHDPAYRDVMTFDDNGVRRAMVWKRPLDKAAIEQRQLYHETLYRMFGYSMFGRLPDVNDSVLLTLVDDPEPWEQNSRDCDSRGFADNIRNFWHKMMTENLNVAPAVIDPPVDRSRPDAEAESPNCKVVEIRPDGIVISGVKAVATASAFADYIFVGVFWRPGMPGDQVMFLTVPLNAPGLTILGRESVGRPGASPEEHPLITMGDELDNTIILDHVFVPREHIFHLGNPEHAMHYPQRLFDWLHWADLIRFVVRAELMAGLALLVGDGSGLLKIPATAARIADIIRFRETLRAFLIAANETGFITPGGMYKPNNVMLDFGRGHYQEHANGVMHELVDLSGRSALIQPAASDFEEFGAILDPMLKGAWNSGRERLKVFRVIRDLFLSEWSGRSRMFDQFNGTPLHAIRMLTMMRTEFSPNGPLTAFAREVCGIELVEGQTSVKKPTVDYVSRQDAKIH